MPDTMAWLRAGIPLTLVIDMLDDDGPHSSRIVDVERPTAEGMAWLSGIRTPPTGPHPGFVIIT